jgi:hypothetical protein
MDRELATDAELARTLIWAGIVRLVTAGFVNGEGRLAAALMK